MSLKQARPNMHQHGQAMAEYVVVMAFGIMALTLGDPSPVERLADVINENWRGYSYAISMSDIPDTIDMASAQAQYLADGGSTSTMGKATNYNGMLSSISDHIGDLPEYCKEMPTIQLRDLENGPLGVGGAEHAPVGRCKK